jgi:hypothetical protein
MIDKLLLKAFLWIGFRLFGIAEVYGPGEKVTAVMFGLSERDLNGCVREYVDYLDSRFCQHQSG